MAAMKWLRLPSLALLLAASLSAGAVDLAGRDLFIPIAGRTAGAAGTFWQTDLIITNLSPEYSRLPVRIEFRTGELIETMEVMVGQGASVVLEDFVRTRLDREQALGTLRITAAPLDAQIIAQAIVVNTGGMEPGRELGQTVPGIPITGLTAQSQIGGLLISAGHRSNIGVANPHDERVSVFVSATDGLGFGRKELRLEPHAVIQLDARDVLAFPSEEATVTARIDASLPVYAYGSVIRHGAGDPQFVLPVATRKSSVFIVPPSCAGPAPLRFAVGAAPGWIVVFHPGHDVEARTAELAARHGFTPLSVYAAIGLGFYAELTPEQRAALQCEPVVQYIEQNAFLSGPQTTAGSLN